MTAPQIGNTGVNDEDPESGRIWVSGFVVRDPTRVAVAAGAAAAPRRRARRPGRRRHQRRRHPRADPAPARARRDAGRHLQRATLGRRDALERVLASPQMVGADLAHEVTTAEPYVVPAVGEKRFTVAALDLGIKARDPALPGRSRAARCTCCPPRPPAPTCSRSSPDGVFFSNGPGDPATTDGPVAAAQAVLDAGVPLFGICFGNQILGRALGLGTYKLRYGHRGVNQPVLELRHRPGARHQPQPRLRRRRPDRRHAGRHPVRPGRGQPRRPQRRRRRGPALPGRPAPSPCSTTRRRPPARTTPTGLFDAVRRADGARRVPQARRPPARARHRLRPDPHRPGRRVRLLRHPGLPRAARPRACGSPSSTATRPRS